MRVAKELGLTISGNSVVSAVSTTEAQPWVSVLANRCQVLAGEIPQAEGHDLAQHLRQLASGVPLHLLARERLVTHAIFSQILGKTASITGIAQLPEVARAFVTWAAIDPTSDSLNFEVDRIAACCAGAIEARRVAAGDIDPRAARALVVIQQRFADRSLTRSDVARESGASVWHVTRLLKQSTGSSFSTHLHRLRIASACQMLRATRLSTKEIAAAAGYGSSSQFGRHFRQLVGTTPQAYRRKLV